MIVFLIGIFENSFTDIVKHTGPLRKKLNMAFSIQISFVFIGQGMVPKSQNKA